MKHNQKPIDPAENLLRMIIAICFWCIFMFVLGYFFV